MVNVSQNNNNQVQHFFAKLDDQHKNADTSTIDKKDTAVKSIFDQAKAETNAKIANIDVGDNETLKNKLTSKLGNVKNIINNQYLNSLNSINETYSTDSQESADAADAGFNAKKDAEIGNINNTIESLLTSMKAEAEAELKQEEAAKQLKEGEIAESTPTESAKKETTVYAEYGESFDATAKRLGFEKGTDEYNKFLAANSEAAGRSKGGWFKVGEDVKIPDDIKEKANKEQIDEQRNNDIKQQSVQKYKDVQAEKARLAAEAKRARMEEHGLKDEANRGKKLTFTVNGKQETYVVQGTSKDRGRILVKGKDGYHYVSHDGKLLKDAYSASTTTNVKNGKVKLGRETYTITKDSAGRTIASDSSGKMVAAQSADGKNLKLGYVQNKQKMESSGAANKMQALKSAYQNAQNSFDAQMKKDGWAADVADGISHLWNNDLINLTGNTASQVRAELAEFKNKLSQMEAAYKKGDIETFNRLQSELSSKNIQKRVDNYNQSQDAGAEVVKTTAKVGAAVVVGVATGGTGLVALGTAAAVTTAASVVIDETDRMNITGSYTDANGNKVETEGTFREGTDHAQIFKNAAWDGVGVLAGGVVGKGAQMLSKGSKYMKAGLSMTGDVATGAVQEKLQTGEVTVAGTLMNAAGSAVGSAAELGYFKKAKDSLGAKFKKVNVDTPTEAPVPKQRPTMDPPKYVVPENESVLAKATRNGNDPSAVAPQRSVGKLNDEKFAQVKVEVQERLAKIDVADSQDLELLQKQVDALQDRSQRRELEAMIKAKKAELNVPKAEPISTPVTEKPDPISTPKSEPTPTPTLKPDPTPIPSHAQLSKGQSVELPTDAKLKIGQEIVDMENLPSGLKSKIDALQEGQEIKIGRNDINPNDMTISSEHLIIRKENGKLKITDTSTNGTVLMDAANVEAYNSVKQIKSQNNFLSPAEFTKYEKQFLKVFDGDYTLLNKFLTSEKIDFNSHSFKNIMNSTNENNSAILRQFIENPKSVKKGSFIHQSITQEDLSLLMLFNRNNTDVSSIISSPKNIDNFLTRANQELTNLRNSYGNVYVEKLANVNQISNTEIADAILKGKTTINGHTFDCSPSTNVLDDMENLIHGKDYIEHFSGKTPDAVFKQTQVGDIANINGKMYVNDGNSMVQLSLSEESFRELFPPVKRFSLHQGSVGTCYLDTSINILANSKKGRAKLYQMVGEETKMGANGPEKVFYTTTANGKGQKTYFERFTRSNRNLGDKNGLALIEQGYCMNSQRHALNHSEVTRIMIVNEGGNGVSALRGLTGDVAIQVSDNKEMREKIMKLAGRDDVFMYASSKNLNGNGHDHWINEFYDVAQTHAYTVKGYDVSTDCVIISNPWHSGVQTNIPMKEFLNSFRRIDVAQIM